MPNCSICGIEVKKFGIGAHKRLAHNSGVIYPGTGKTKRAWNKGLTKDTDPRLKKAGETQKQSLKDGKFIHPTLGTKRSQETKDKISQTMREKEGYHLPSRVTVEYNGIKLQSNYELAVAKSLDENVIKWTRPSFFNYVDETGKIRKYFPDFYLPEYNVYLDPKNDYLLVKDKFKIESVIRYNNIKVIMLSKDNLHWNSIKELL